MGLTQKEKDWIIRTANYLRKNENCRLEVIHGRSGAKAIRVNFQYGKKVKEQLDRGGRNNFNNKQRRIFNRLVESMYFIIFMEKTLPGITLMARDIALERLKNEKMLMR